MYKSAIIIFFAMIFSSLLNEKLFTGIYLAKLILPYISMHWVPLITFIITTLVAMGTGSSWGTIIIMTQISIQLVGALSGLPNPIALPDIYILLPTIGAVISGSVAGAQLSPIADPVTISSTSAGCYQIDHVRTQLPYIMPSVIGACASFTAAGFLKINTPSINALICLTIGLSIAIIMLIALNMFAKKTTAPHELTIKNFTTYN
jgi:Na+/H+ antiporter NhaC